MSRKDDAKAHDGQVTVNVDDFTRTRESVSSLVFLQKWFCEDAAAPPPRIGGGFSVPPAAHPSQHMPTPTDASSKQTTCAHSISIYLPMDYRRIERRVE